jgi:hypothetical protein
MTTPAPSHPWRDPGSYLSLPWHGIPTDEWMVEADTHQADRIAVEAIVAGELGEGRLRPVPIGATCLTTTGVAWAANGKLPPMRLWGRAWRHPYRAHTGRQARPPAPPELPPWPARLAVHTHVKVRRQDGKLALAFTIAVCRFRCSPGVGWVMARGKGTQVSVYRG